MTWSSIADAFRRQRLERHNATKTWLGRSDVEKLRLNPIIEGRLLEILHPGQVRPINGVAFQGPQGGLTYQGMLFRVPSVGWENLAVDDSDWSAPGWWGWGSFNFSQLLSAGLPRPYYDILTQAIEIFHRAQSAMPFVPRSTWDRWYAAVRAGGLPYMFSTRGMQASPVDTAGGLPSWLQDPYHQQAWELVRTQVLLLHTEVTDANRAQVLSEARRVSQDLQFWDTVAKWSGAAAVEAQWTKLKAAIRSFNSNKAATLANVERLEQMIAATPGAFTDAQKAEVRRIRAETETNTRKAQAALDGPIMQALLGEGVGIGVAPVVILAGAAVIGAVLTTIVALAAMQAGLTAHSNHLQAEFVTAREAFTNAQYAAEQAAIAQRKRELDALLTENKLAPDAYAAQVRQLDLQTQAAAGNLLEQRKQSTQAAIAYNQALKQNQDLPGEGAITGFANMTKWLALGAVGIGAIVILPRVLPKKR